MNLVVRGGGFKNKGAEAMLRTVQRELGRRLGPITVHAVCPTAHAALAWRSGVIPVPPPADRLTPLCGARLARCLHLYGTLLRKRRLHDACSALVRFTRVYRETTVRTVLEGACPLAAVVDISGFAYGDAWSRTPILNTLEWVQQCRSRKTPYLFLPQAWGPFTKPGFRAPMVAALQAATVYYARDAESRAQLASALACAPETVPVRPDIAFGFEGAATAVGRLHLERAGLTVGKGPLIGITPNYRVYRRCEGTGAGNQYVRTLVSLCDWCTAVLGAQVALIPNEMAPPGDTVMDDRFICGLVQMHVKNRQSCVALDEYVSAEVLKAALGQLDLLIGSRFHSLVFALSAGVPCVALSWSHKYRELLDAFGNGHLACEVSDLSPDKVLPLMQTAWNERQRLREAITRRLPLVLNEINGMFDELAAHLAARKS